jgi:hypothetical protein
MRALLVELFDEVVKLGLLSGGGTYLDLRGLPLDPLPEIDEAKIAGLARAVRGLLFPAVDAAQSGHPGGSSSKVKQVITLLLSGAPSFDARAPKNPGRDRIVWSAGHCSPLFHALVALVYDTLRARGITVENVTYPEDLARFRRWVDRAGTSNQPRRWLTRPPAHRGTAFRRDWDSRCCTGGAVCRRGLLSLAGMRRPRRA